MPVPDTLDFNLHDVVYELGFALGTTEGYTINSVTDDGGGDARFNTADTESMVVGSWVYINTGSQYSDGWYEVTAVSTDSYFELDYIPYNGNDSGNWYGGGSLTNCFNNAFGPAFDATYRGDMDRQYNFRNYNHGLGQYTTISEIKSTARSGRANRISVDYEDDITDSWEEARDAASSDSVKTWPDFAFDYRYDVETTTDIWIDPGPPINAYWKVKFKRNYLEFDLSGIPANSTCRSAKLTLYGGTFLFSVSDEEHDGKWENMRNLVPVIIGNYGTLDVNDYNDMFYAIDTIEDYSGFVAGTIKITTVDNHELHTGNTVQIDGTTHYDGEYSITTISDILPKVFYVTKAYVSDISTGTFLKRALTGAYTKSGSPGSETYTFDSVSGDNDLIQNSFGSTLRIVVMTGIDYRNREMQAWTGEQFEYIYDWQYHTGYPGQTAPSMRIEWGAPAY